MCTSVASCSHGRWTGTSREKCRACVRICPGICNCSGSWKLYQLIVVKLIKAQCRGAVSMIKAGLPHGRVAGTSGPSKEEGWRNVELYADDELCGMWNSTGMRNCSGCGTVRGWGTVRDEELCGMWNCVGCGMEQSPQASIQSVCRVVNSRKRMCIVQLHQLKLWSHSVTAICDICY
jgi:hypothetical protein